MQTYTSSGSGPRSLSIGLLLRGGAIRFVMLALLWLALTEGDLDTWWLGFLAVVAATLASLALLPPAGRRWSPVGAIRFAGFFFCQSVVGGIDVALRALKPGLNLDPALVEYETRLPEGGAQALFANTVSLLPGSLSAEVRDRKLGVHTLDAASGVHDELRRTEEAVARIFGVELDQELGDG